jgi:hypothetical protein
MIREILTLDVDATPTQYYITFAKERREFGFQPTFQHKAAPSFMIFVSDGKLLSNDLVSGKLLAQAKEKVKEILESNLFDQF